ncbi:CHAT domain-containing protein [Multifurca ochricompacta]|uniref:CHAT domain-containing protein n=1 Tax=Multifurca ochricompacta TaxID=376703 RepID=A0AAD4QFK7_9AGAM|nr:CHAT domain-containing protein [Multifurca ochricompacta]
MAQELSIMELDQIITSYQCALSWTPRSHPTYTACIHLLAKSQFIRYELSEQKEDLDKSIVHYTEAIFLPPSRRFYLNVVQVFFQLVLSLLHRSEKFKQPEDAKCAVEYLRYLRGLPLDTFEVPHEFVTPSLVRALGIQVELEAGGTGDIEEMVILCQELLICHSSADYSAGAIAIVALSGVIIEVFSQGKHVQPLDEVIQCLRDALKICPPDLHVVPLGLATALIIRFWKIYSNDDYEEAMTLLESIAGSSPLGDNPSEIQIQASASATSLARMRADFFPNPEYLEEAISRCLLPIAWHPSLNKVVYLDESITVHRGVLKMQSAQPFYLSVIQQLFVSLFKRLELLGRRQDLDEVIELFPLGVNDKFAKVPDRFAFSCLWAFITRAARHPSVSVAYEKAMPLMQSSLVSAPTLQIQHAQLVAMRGLCDKMPLDYASYQIDMGQFTQAIETLEQGRALLWSEMRDLRNSIDQLSGFNSPLATKLAAINQDLESLTMSVTLSGIIEISDGGSQVDDGMDPFGILVVKKQELLEERDVLLSNAARWRYALRSEDLGGDLEINFRRFWIFSSTTAIGYAARTAPTILSPSLIPTSNDFYQRANKLRDRLVVARKEGLDSERYGRALRSVLEGLYKLVGEPVIDKLRTLGVPEQSRIWWCPTSVFCSLPLHAMGPIPSNDGVKRYFSDLYIPSYTPTLSALIESRKPSPKTSYEPSLLLVATPDESLPGAFGEMEIIQSLNSRVPVATLCGKNATSAGVVEGLRHHGFAHFVCHGTLETGKPFDASFKLFDGERLTLLEIVRSRLPAGEFAFLAACHTAELTDESIADEGLHLTAAVQYCGFRSVVGTIWEMADIDGHELSENFYKSMFSRNGEGVGYHLRSARALRDATRKMRRKKGMTLERWVNFVHYVYILHLEYRLRKVNKSPPSNTRGGWLPWLPPQIIEMGLQTPPPSHCTIARPCEFFAERGSTRKEGRRDFAGFAAAGSIGLVLVVVEIAA